MLVRQGEEFPLARPIRSDVYGKRVFMHGRCEQDVIHYFSTRGVQNVCLAYNPVKGMIGAILSQAEDFDMVIMDPNLAYMQDVSPSQEGMRHLCGRYMDELEEFQQYLNLALEPYRSWEIVGPDYYLKWLDEAFDRNLPVVPVISREDLGFYTEHVFPRFPYVAITREMSLNKTFLHSVFVAAKQAGVAIIGLGIEETYTIERYPWLFVINGAWENGHKYGSSYFFDEHRRFRRFAMNAKKQCRQRYRSLIESNGLNYDGIIADLPQPVNDMNLKAWSDYNDYLAVDFHGSYWLSDLEAAEAKRLYLGTKTDDPAIRDIDFAQQVKDAVREDGRTINRYLQIESEEEVSFVDARNFVGGKCDKCLARNDCDEFRPGAACAFMTYAKVKNRKDLINMLGAAMGTQYNRVMMATLMERLMGNELSAETSREMQLLFKNGDILNRIMKEVLNPGTPGQGPSGSGLTLTLQGEQALGQGVGLVQALMNQARDNAQKRALPASSQQIDITPVPGDRPASLPESTHHHKLDARPPELEPGDSNEEED